MSLVITFFDTDFKGKTYKLHGKYFEHFVKVFPGYKKMLQKEKECIAFFAGKENENAHVYKVQIEKTDILKSSILFELGHSERLDLSSKYVRRQLRKISERNGWDDERNMPPVVCILQEREDLLSRAKKQSRIVELLEQKDYNAVCMLFAPLSEANTNPNIWNDADVLYALGLSCSKLAVSLLTPSGDKKTLEKKSKYRRYAIAFLRRGYGIEEDSARFATALAYRYYSNVHELLRPGERRDQNLEEEIKLANEWLSIAIEMNPQSVRNHYRKGKLIIEKQVPYLLFAKRSFGKAEASTLREIKQVGEEHLAQAVMLYENLEDEDRSKADRREYAKALFVLGKYYLNDTNLPMHEYYLAKLSGINPSVSIAKIDKLNLESARVHLKACFAAECSMPLDKLDIKKLAATEKQWANSPIKKLYQLGCVYSDTAFVLMTEGDEQKAYSKAKKAIFLLESAKKISDSLKDRKRNTWYISERIAWTYMHLKKYEVAARLLKNARAGYVVNTLAIALLLCSVENAPAAKQKLRAAAKDKHNLAKGLSQVLYAFVTAKEGRQAELDKNGLSEKNKRYAKLLGI